MSFLNRAATAGNMQTYQTDLAAKQSAETIANAINALKLQQGQNDMAGSGIAGNALMGALSGGGDASGAPQGQALQPPIMPPPVQQAPMPQMPMPGAMPMPPGAIPPPPGGNAPAMQSMPQGGSAPGIPPISMSALRPPGGMPQQQPTPPAQMAGQPAPQQPGMPQSPQGGITWQKIATTIKQQNPNAKGPEIMAAIEKLTPMLSSQNKMEWEQFKVLLQNQVKEQGLQNQLTVANQRASTAERGQDVKAASELAATKQRADAAEARVQELEANRTERGREADQKNSTALQSIATRLQTAKKTGTDPAYKALEAEYKTTAAEQRSMMNNPGMYDDAAKAAMEQKVEALKTRVDAYTKTAAPSASGAAPVGDRVSVTKDGQEFTVPAEQLQDAISQGYTRKQ